jgi:KDO2-lipid IV(A) lauroyltransferase
MLSYLGIGLMRFVALWPLRWVRALGTGVGLMLLWLIPQRRRIAQVNVALCFPQLSKPEQQALVREIFIYFTQAWFDRAWLWHAKPEVVLARTKLVGAVEQLHGTEPTLLFGPHFVGLDAAATVISQRVPRRYTTLYAVQKNKVFDAWITKGRQRFAENRLIDRHSGFKPIVSALRQGDPFYLLPDMDFGAEDSFFVPFFGVSTATVPSLSRFARLGRARVVPVLPRLTPEGYEVHILPAWTDFPTADAEADTALMNQRLQAYIETMPAQYFWVHKRFKSRPPGEADVYKRKA